jgi:uncharacterized protein YbaR (Trm112 family)
MKFRLLGSIIRCPVCRSVLRLEDPAIHRVDRELGSGLPQCRGLCPFPEVVGQPRDCSACVGYEVVGGFLLCSNCGQRYAIDEGIPRLCHPDPGAATRAKVRTASSYGYLWGRSAVTPDVSSYHFDRMEGALSLSAPHGLILAFHDPVSDLSPHPEAWVPRRRFPLPSRHRAVQPGGGSL